MYLFIALQQKFHFLRDEIEVTYLDPLHKGANISKVSALLGIMAYLYNAVIKLFNILVFMKLPKLIDQGRCT